MHFQQTTFRIPQLKHRFEELLTHLWGLGAAVKADLESLDLTIHANPDVMVKARAAVEDVMAGRDIGAVVNATAAAAELVEDEKSTSGTEATPPAAPATPAPVETPKEPAAQGY